MSDSDVGASPAPLRRDQIVDLVQERGFARVSELSARFGISEVTVRTDLDQLEAAGRLSRVHGGAMAQGLLSTRRAPEPAFEEAEQSLRDEKTRIATAAASLVTSGSSVLLDVGTTTTAVARELVARDDLVDVVIFTNGLNIALALEPAIPRFTVIVTGGTLRPLQHSLVSPLAGGMLDEINADIAFLGCNGVDPDRGITNINLPEADMKRRMLRAASRRVVVADSSKIGQVHVGRVARIDEVDALVTGVAADAAILDALDAHGLAITVV